MTETPKPPARRGPPYKGSGKSITRNISMTPETAELLDRKVAETGLSMSEIIRQALERMA